MSFTKIALGLLSLAVVGVLSAKYYGSSATGDDSSAPQSTSASEDRMSDTTTAIEQVASVREEKPSNLGRPISPEERKKRVQTKDLVMGASKQAVSGSQVTFHITVKLKDGKVPIDSRKEGEPWKGVLGNGSMMNGLNEGLQGMFKGGKRAIWIPAHLAYGSGGGPGQIPPDSDLYVEVEMISVF